LHRHKFSPATLFSNKVRLCKLPRVHGRCTNVANLRQNLRHPS
jgi:hypothetical protein